MNFFKRLVFWIIFSFFAAESVLAQKGQTFTLDQFVSYMHLADTLQLLAAQNRPEAQTQLAELYEHGLGVPQSFPKAIDLYRQAALSGFKPARTKLRSLGVSVLAESETEITDKSKAGKSSTTPKLQITINVKYLNSSKPAFGVWSPQRIVLKRMHKKKRSNRHRPFISVQRQSARRLLSSSQSDRPGFGALGMK